MPDKKKVEEEISKETVATEEIDVETVEEIKETEEVQEVQDETSKVVSNFEPLVDTEQTAEPQSEENQAEDTVTVQPVRFASFEDLSQTQGEANKNLDILMDIKLQLTVELGRTELPIKKVLELTRGSIIELEKVAGEPVELYANGKLVAHGEVVVIEDNFGLRITSITDAEERLKGVQ